MRGRLVALLAEEEKALASLGGPRSHMVSDLGNLVGFEGADGLEVDGVRAEPEELLGVDEVPAQDVRNCNDERVLATTYLGKLAPWPLCSRLPSSTGFASSSFLASSTGAAAASVVAAASVAASAVTAGTASAAGAATASVAAAVVVSTGAAAGASTGTSTGFCVSAIV